MVNIRKATNKEKESRVGRLIQGEASFVESAARSAAFTLCPEGAEGPTCASLCLVEVFGPGLTD